MAPYEIFQRVGKVAYSLKIPIELASVYPFFHVSMLKKCLGDPVALFLLKVLVSRITSIMRMFRFKLFIGKKEVEEKRGGFRKGVMEESSS